jgi:hypothetical protein
MDSQEGSQRVVEQVLSAAASLATLADRGGSFLSLPSQPSERFSSTGTG